MFDALAPSGPTESILRLTAFDLIARDRVVGATALLGGDIDFEHPLSFSWPGRKSTRYLASTTGRTTAADDVPANTVIPGGLSGIDNLSPSLFDGLDPSGGRSSRSAELVITDLDGSLDNLLDTALDGAALALLRGEHGAPVSTFGVVARLTTAGLRYDGKEKSLFIRDLSWLLEAAPLHGLRYQGTGDYEGDAGLTNELRPILFGAARRIPAKLIVANLQIYQVSCTQIEGIDVVEVGGAGLAATVIAVGSSGDPAPAGATIGPVTASAGAKEGVYHLTCVTAGVSGTWTVKDPDGITVGVATTGTPFSAGGLAFTITDSGADPALGEEFIVTATLVDYPNFAALKAATVAPGYYATCLARGLFRLGAQPSRQVTVDARGENVGGYHPTRSRIAQRVATGYGTLKFAVTDLDAASFAALDAAQPAPCGWYFDGEITKAAALDQIMVGCLGLWWVDQSGKLLVDYLREPPAEVDFVLTMPRPGQDAGDGDIVSAPAMDTYSPPRQATHLGYVRNYTPQTQDQLAGEVSASDALDRSLDTRTVTSRQSRLRYAWPAAPIATLPSGLADEDDAQDEADRQQTLRGVPRGRWNVGTSLLSDTPVLMKSVSIRGWDRYGMVVKSFWCVGSSSTAQNRLVLELWG